MMIFTIHGSLKLKISMRDMKMSIENMSGLLSYAFTVVHRKRTVYQNMSRERVHLGSDLPNMQIMNAHDFARGRFQDPNYFLGINMTRRRLKKNQYGLFEEPPRPDHYKTGNDNT